MARPCCTVDFETASELDVRDVGAHRYAEHESTRILCLRYKINGGLNRLWTPDLPFPTDLLLHIATEGILDAHSAAFERAIWRNLLVPLGVPMPRYWKDTQARCANRGLPLPLDDVGDVLNLDVKKDKRGKYLLQKLSSPQKMTKTMRKKWALEHPEANPDDAPLTYWIDDWQLLSELYDYCGQDVDSEESLRQRIGELPPNETRIWVLDQIINERGVRLDLEAVYAAISVVETMETYLEKELSDITGGAVETGGQRDRILEWLLNNGLELPALTKDLIEDILGGLNDWDGYEPQPHVKRVLELRQLLSKSSTTKLYKMLEFVCDDGRIRGMLQYHGAGTGRWAGRGPQPQNFPRPHKDLIKIDIECLIAAIKTRDIPLIELLFGNAMEVISTALRGMFIAAVDKILRVVDFASIEARVVMWVADQQDALDAFAAYDRKEGPNIYCVMAQKLYGRPISKADLKEYTLGKITILGAGYQMGAKKLKFQAWKEYKVKLDESTALFLITGYRETYHKVKSMWYAVEEAAIEAVNNPGTIVRYSKVAYQTVRDDAGFWLTCILPNGRRIWYCNPSVRKVEVTYASGQKRIKDQLWYWGRDNKKGGHWSCITTYGGMLVENFVQAIARDLMAEAMLRVEAKGYSIILTVHDELVSENEPSFGSLAEFSAITAEVPAWASGLPIAVESWEGPRYRK